MFYAHSRPGAPQERWDILEEHLRRTAQRAAQYLPQAPELAYMAGMWHDVGKYQPEFQRYLLSSADGEASNEQRPGRIQHSIVGSALALSRVTDTFLKAALAWAIAAHHGGLSDRGLLQRTQQFGNDLLNRCKGCIPASVLNISEPPPLIGSSRDLANGLMQLWIRMLLSALSDADMLDSEAWDKGCERSDGYATLPQLRDRLNAAMDRKRTQMERDMLMERPINLMRAQVLSACLRVAHELPGQFTLTVPTGGGKTLSSLAFALHHACQHGMQRVIVVIPYTSIIEQTAQVFRTVLGEENVVEHHSSVELDKDTWANQRACENWDAPVIVTTSVQFLESLYAARKTRCRKLHNIANSVVVLDEVQTFPVDLLAPIRNVLGLLSEHFGTSVVYCTATQPTPDASVPIGPPMRPVPVPIIAQVDPLFRVVEKRFRIIIEGNIDQPLELDGLAEKLKQHESVMAIVHSRSEAGKLAGMVPGSTHLSARMCAQHRKEVLDRVRYDLQAKRPCRLVATQLIEAGVDISFPVVYRALAGLETLAQAAGRCNRELDGEQPGEFHIFRAPSQPPSNSLRRALAVALKYLHTPGFELNLNVPGLFLKYFSEVLDPNKVTTDSPGIALLEKEMDFPSVEDKFRMIDENGQTILAPYGDWKQLLKPLRYGGPTRENLRKLQRYFVQLYDREIDQLQKQGLIEPLYSGADRAWSVRDGAEYIYSREFGFGWQGRENTEPERLMV
jgi:CRISPR-associated endonuclease/helicase Cas3